MQQDLVKGETTLNPPYQVDANSQRDESSRAIGLVEGVPYGARMSGQPGGHMGQPGQLPQYVQTGPYPGNYQQPYPYGQQYAVQPQQQVYVETTYVEDTGPMPCFCGVQWTLFLLGWFLTPLWFIAAFLPICMRKDRREIGGWIANLCMVFTVVLLVVIFTCIAKFGHYRWGYYYYNNQY